MFGDLLTTALPADPPVGMLCSKVAEADGGLLELTPASQPPEAAVKSVLVHPRHILCILRKRIGREPPGF